jgi:hypothetical protein
MRRRVMDGAVTTILLVFSFVGGSVVYCEPDPAWWVAALTLAAWIYVKYWSDSAGVKTSFLIWATVLSFLWLESILPDWRWGLPPLHGLPSLYEWSPIFPIVFTLAVMLSTALGRRLSPRARAVGLWPLRAPCRVVGLGSIPGRGLDTSAKCSRLVACLPLLRQHRLKSRREPRCASQLLPTTPVLVTRR